MEATALSFQYLNELFTFHGTGGKNQDFSASTQNQIFTINNSFQGATFSYPAILPGISAGGNITYTSPVTYTMKKNNFYLLLLIDHGEGTIQIDTTPYQANPNSLFLIPPETPLSFFTQKTPFTYHIYFLTGESILTYYHKLQPQNDAPILCTQLEPADFFRNNLRQIQHELSQKQEDNHFYIANCLSNVFTQLIRQLSQTATADMQYPKHVTQMLEIFNQNFRENHYLDTLESSLKVSKFRLCHDFSKHVGCSPIQYLNKIRIEKAKDYLINTNITIHEIGTLVGIPNTNHFIRLFQKYTGTTPLRYRLDACPFL
jgi:AraC-like DNA-binding protein